MTTMDYITIHRLLFREMTKSRAVVYYRAETYVIMTTLEKESHDRLQLPKDVPKDVPLTIKPVSLDSWKQINDVIEQYS